MVCKAVNYTDENRGAIQHRNRAKQIIDFSGIRFNNITPTDIDGFIDYKNTAFVFMEMKLTGAEMPYGQELALERLVDAITESGRHNACALLCRHDKKNPDEDIVAAETNVERIYWNGAWRATKRRRTAKEVIDSFLHFVSELV